MASPGVALPTQRPEVTLSRRTDGSLHASPEDMQRVVRLLAELGVRVDDCRPPTPSLTLHQEAQPKQAAPRAAAAVAEADKMSSAAATAIFAASLAGAIDRVSAADDATATATAAEAILASSLAAAIGRASAMAPADAAEPLDEPAFQVRLFQDANDRFSVRLLGGERPANSQPDIVHSAAAAAGWASGVVVDARSSSDAAAAIFASSLAGAIGRVSAAADAEAAAMAAKAIVTSSLATAVGRASAMTPADVSEPPFQVRLFQDANDRFSVRLLRGGRPTTQLCGAVEPVGEPAFQVRLFQDANDHFSVRLLGGV